jgi:beta-glucosidase
MKLGLAIAGLAVLISSTALAQEQPVLGRRSAAILTIDGLNFKDLDRDGQLSPYEDWRLPAPDRASDLLKMMTLEEKAGLMMHGTAPSLGAGSGMGAGSEYDAERARHMINGTKVVTFITRLSGDPGKLATQNNKLQEIAEEGRLGIPATISTDPRNHFQFVPGASVAPGAFSKWPEMLGFAAIGDAKLTQRFADIARQEYRAVGIQEALSPQIDLSTEPRWGRANGTFGEDAQLSKELAEAYIAGFQNGDQGINGGSVIAVAKHWVGYGAAKDGWDGHNAYGRHADFSKGNFEEHLVPFEGAFRAKVAGVMPTYSILDGVEIDGKPLEPVAAGYSKQLLTDLLRGRFGFDGVILSDWLITNDCEGACLNGEQPGVKPTLNEETFGMPWGVEKMVRVDRFAKAVNAGIDQFGGVTSSGLIVEAVKDGKITEKRIDESAMRILLQKFRQGLFENPYSDPERARDTVGNPAFVAEATSAQAKAAVVLENRNDLLPLAGSGRKLYLYGIDPSVATSRGFRVVDTPLDAELAVIRMNAPAQMLHGNYFFGSRQQEGDLDFKPGNPEYAAFTKAANVVPTIATIYLSRPAVIPELQTKASALIGNFGLSDEALFDVIEGKTEPLGKLPFELPSSMAAVNAQASDVAHDTLSPLYHIHYGLRFQH